MTRHHRPIPRYRGLRRAAGWLFGALTSGVVVTLPLLAPWTWPLLIPVCMSFVIGAASVCGREAAGMRSPREEVASLREALAEARSHIGYEHALRVDVQRRLEADLALARRQLDRTGRTDTTVVLPLSRDDQPTQVIPVQHEAAETALIPAVRSGVDR